MDAPKPDPESLQGAVPPGGEAKLPLVSATAANREPFLSLSLVAFIFLTVNCVQAVFRASDDPWTLSFVVSAYAALLLLFWCLRQLERLPRDGSRGAEERRLKLAVWALAMLLSGMFSYRVATMMPPAFAAVIWAIAGFTTLAGFYALFVYQDAPTADVIIPPVTPGKI